MSQDYADAVAAARDQDEDEIILAARRMLTRGVYSLRVAPDSILNRLRAERGLQPLTDWPAGTDGLSWNPS